MTADNKKLKAEFDKPLFVRYGLIGLMMVCGIILSYASFAFTRNWEESQGNASTQ